MVFTSIVIGQQDSIRRAVKIEIKNGDNFFNEKKFKMALFHYSQAVEMNSENAEANLKTGHTYLNIINKHRALPYLEKAFKINPNIDKDIYFLLAQAHHLNAQWDRAIEEYTKYNESGRGDKGVIAKKIEECRRGKELSSHLIKVRIENLGDSINSVFPDYDPQVSADESVLLFTSQRPNKADPAKTFLGFETVFISYNKNGHWSKAVSLKEPVNKSNENSSAIAISYDAKEMMICKSDNNDKNIYSSSWKPDRWSEPVKLPKGINSSSQECSVSLSRDGKSMYFVSDRKEGMGGKDIYMSVKNDKEEWSLPTNLGQTINTIYDEESAVIDPDGKTLYFSSKGHTTSGGYDVFKSGLMDGKWSTPENMGYPINSPDDDVFFAIPSNGKRAYYSSVKETSLGEQDIYCITWME